MYQETGMEDPDCFASMLTSEKVRGGWFLNIPAVDFKAQPNIGVSIQTDSLLLEENKVYEFKLGDNYQPIKGTVNAFYYNGTDTYPKLNNEEGYLMVKKIDQVNRIISGIFNFVGTNPNGQKVYVTEGRFDIVY